MTKPSKLSSSFSLEDISSSGENHESLLRGSSLRVPDRIPEDSNEYEYHIPQPQGFLQPSYSESQQHSSSVTSLQSQLLHEHGFFDVDQLLKVGVESFQEEILGSIIKEMLRLPDLTAPTIPLSAFLPTNDANSLMRQAREEAAYRQSTKVLGELPLGWEMRLTEKGRPYFLNHFNLTTTWDDPRGALRDGWEHLVTDNGKTVFVNRAKRRASLTDPRLYVDRGPI